MKFKKIVNKFLRNRPLLMTVCFAFYFLYVATLLFGFDFFGPWRFLLLPVPFIGYEIILRLLLRFVFGRNYRYSLYNYFLVNHPLYGFSLRKGASSSAVDFPVFDKFVFKTGAGQILDPEENKKQRVDFNVNSLGFRGKEFSRKKSDKKTLRIFCSGGSTTACVSNDDAEAWPAVLERKLRERGYDVEVINAGVPAWYSYQELLRFKNEIVNYDPDAVLLHQGWNEEFTYASQNLGKRWRPGILLNIVELKSLYSKVGRLLSSTASIFFHLLSVLYFQDLVFKSNMSFTNPRRWECLKQAAYLQHWFDNLAEFAREASRRGILMFTINYPGLCDFKDSPGDRELYVKSSRLTRLYADYQAVSKKRIQKTLREAAGIIPCLDIEKAMGDLRGADRLELFRDEIHLNTSGNALLGEFICNQLLEDRYFQKLLGGLSEGSDRKSNVVYDDQTAAALRKNIGKNYDYLDRFILKRITELEFEKTDDRQMLEMPSQRYTTF